MSGQIYAGPLTLSIQSAGNPPKLCSRRHKRGRTILPTMPTIASQFVAVGDRQVFVRAAGSGPPLLLLHQSPQNSRAMLPWIERLAVRYAVFAPDTPGFGFSDPLPLASPEIPDYAAAFARLFDSLGFDKAVVFGVHTGAVTALRFALDHPEKVAGLVCDGYARFNADEREALVAGYLPPFEPSWDGLHLAWAWARMREQHFYFPWHASDRLARLNYPVPSTPKLHSDVMDILDAGDGYRVGYRAPFSYGDDTAAARLSVSARLIYRHEDVLASHIDRLPPLPPNVTVQACPMSDLVARCDAAFAELAAPLATIDAVSVLDAAARGPSRIVRCGAAQLVVRSRRGRGARSRWVIGDFARAATMPMDTDAFACTTLIALPGHSVCIGWDGASVNVDQLAAAMATVVADDVIDVHASGASAGLAARVAGILGTRCARLVLDSPLCLTATERDTFVHRLPDPTPVDGGGHLLAAWQWARHRYLFCPWKPQDGAAAMTVAEPAPRRVHADVVELLRCGALAKPLAASLLDATATAAAPRCEIALSAEGDEAARLAARWGLPANGSHQWKRSAA